MSTPGEPAGIERAPAQIERWLLVFAALAALLFAAALRSADLTNGWVLLMLVTFGLAPAALVAKRQTDRPNLVGGIYLGAVALAWLNAAVLA